MFKYKAIIFLVGNFSLNEVLAIESRQSQDQSIDINLNQNSQEMVQTNEQTDFEFFKYMQNMDAFFSKPGLKLIKGKEKSGGEQIQNKIQLLQLDQSINMEEDVKSESPFHHRDHSKKKGKMIENRNQEEPRSLVEGGSPFHHRDHTKKVGKAPEDFEERRSLVEGGSPFHHRDHTKKSDKKPEFEVTQDLQNQPSLAEGSNNHNTDYSYNQANYRSRINPTGDSVRQLRNPAEATGNLMKNGKKDTFSHTYSHSNEGQDARTNVKSARKAFQSAKIDEEGYDVPDFEDDQRNHKPQNYLDHVEEDHSRLSKKGKRSQREGENDNIAEWEDDERNHKPYGDSDESSTSLIKQKAPQGHRQSHQHKESHSHKKKHHSHHQSHHQKQSHQDHQPHLVNKQDEPAHSQQKQTNVRQNKQPVHNNKHDSIQQLSTQELDTPFFSLVEKANLKAEAPKVQSKQAVKQPQSLANKKKEAKTVKAKTLKPLSDYFKNSQPVKNLWKQESESKQQSRAQSDQFHPIKQHNQGWQIDTLSMAQQQNAYYQDE